MRKYLIILCLLFVSGLTMAAKVELKVGGDLQAMDSAEASDDVDAIDLESGYVYDIEFYPFEDFYLFNEGQMLLGSPFLADCWVNVGAGVAQRIYGKEKDSEIDENYMESTLVYASLKLSANPLFIEQYFSLDIGYATNESPAFEEYGELNSVDVEVGNGSFIGMSLGFAISNFLFEISGIIQQTATVKLGSVDRDVELSVVSAQIGYRFGGIE